MSIAAQRYAAALAGAALEQGAMEAVREQLGQFVRLTQESAELKNFLANPAVELEGKHRAAEELASRLGANRIVRNFLLVLVDHDRIPLLGEIHKAFHNLILEREGLAEAQVTSAAQLTPRQRKELVGVLERLTGKKIEAQYAVDPGLMGGAIVRIGSTIYDGSLRTRLERLRTQLTTE